MLKPSYVKSAAIFMGIICGSVTLSFAQQTRSECKFESAKAPVRDLKGHRVSVKPFTIPDFQTILQRREGSIYNINTGKPFYKDEPLEKLRQTLAETIRRELNAAKYFKTVEHAENENVPATDWAIEGEFTTIFQMGGKVHLIGSPVSRMSVKGKLKSKDVTQRFLEFTCESYAEAVFINRPKKQMSKNINNIAKRIRELVTQD